MPPNAQSWTPTCDDLCFAFRDPLQSGCRAEPAFDDAVGRALYDHSEGSGSSVQKSIGAFWD